MLKKNERNLYFFFFFLEYTYDHPKELPTFESSTIVWEQSVVEGHATHPVSFSLLSRKEILLI